MKGITMIKICLTVLTAFAVAIASLPVVQAATPQETLKQYVADLQKNPNDNALREKIIKHVQGMKQKPVIPEDARRHFVRAVTVLEEAKQPSDSAEAAEEFRKALLIAPWWSETYMKMGLALETAQRYDDAIASLKLFMTTKPRDDVLRKTQDEIYKIEMKRDKAAKDSEQARKDQLEAALRQQASKAEEDARALQRKAEDLYGRCDGKRNVHHYEEIGNVSADDTADLRGKHIVIGEIYKSGDRGAIPSNVQIGVWKEMWDLGISRMEIERGRVVLFFDDSNNNWMYEKAYLNEDCEIKFKFKSGSDSAYYIPERR